MNKTININLGGIFFHIDELAYQKLRKYLDAIRRSLSDDPKGKEEILTDIETRIGEILSEKITDVRQVVNEQDIEDIILIMGKPEDYAGDEEIFEDTTYTHKKQNNKKLYRDSEDKFLGGVSSGLAHYFGVDTIWVRIFWLILAFGFGIGFMFYLILWILVPKANSTTEKLEMEGEAVNISNIEKKIRAEFNDASQRVRDGIDDVSEHIKNNNYQEKVKSGSQEIVSLFGRIFTVFFKVIGKFIGILLIIISASTLIGIIIGGFSLGSVEFLGMGNEFANYPPFFYNSRIPIWLLTIFLLVAISIPFVILFIMGLKIISSNVKSFNRTTNLSLLGIWLIAILGMAFAGIEYKAHDAREFTKTDKYDITTQVNDTLNISMITKGHFEERRYFNPQTIFEGEVEKFYGTNIRLDIRESNSNTTYIKVYKEAFGVSTLKAKELANHMQYNYDTINNDLKLDAYFLSDLKNKYRHQNVKLIIYIPKGKTIYLNKSTKNFLNDVDNVQDIYDRSMIRHYYRMTNEGLNCLDCDEFDDDNDNDKSFKLKINEDGVDINVKDKKLKIDENGVDININDKKIKINEDGVKVD